MKNEGGQNVDYSQGICERIFWIEFKLIINTPELVISNHKVPSLGAVNIKE